MEEKSVYLIITDTAKKQHLSAYGYERLTTPFLEDFQDESIKFTNAVSQSPWTLPSHASMFTGKYPSEHGAVQENPYMESQETVSSLLEENGYKTGIFSANAWISPHTGLAQNFGRKENFIGNLPDTLERLTSYAWKKSNENKYLSGLADKVASAISWVHNNVIGQKYDSYTPQIMESARNFVKQNKDEEKFVCMNLLDPHLPYDPPIESIREFRDLDEKPEVCLDQNKYNSGATDIDEDEWEKIKLLYDAEIRYADEKIEDFIQFLKSEGEYENSLIIICSDHGELHGGNDLYGHQFGLYEDLINVPLFVKHPDGSSGESNQLVELMDLFHTIIDFTGVDDGFNSGRSIINSDYRSSDKVQYPNYAFSEYSKPLVVLEQLEKSASKNGLEIPDNSRYKSEMISVRGQNAKYIYRSNTDDELYPFTDGKVGDDNILHSDTELNVEHYLDIANGFERVGNVDVESVGTDAIDNSIKDRLDNLGYLEN